MRLQERERTHNPFLPTSSPSRLTKTRYGRLIVTLPRTVKVTAPRLHPRCCKVPYRLAYQRLCVQCVLSQRENRDLDPPRWVRGFRSATSVSGTNYRVADCERGAGPPPPHICRRVVSECVLGAWLGVATKKGKAAIPNVVFSASAAAPPLWASSVFFCVCIALLGVFAAFFIYFINERGTRGRSSYIVLHAHLFFFTFNSEEGTQAFEEQRGAISFCSLYFYYVIWFRILVICEPGFGNAQVATKNERQSRESCVEPPGFPTADSSR